MAVGTNSAARQPKAVLYLRVSTEEQVENYSFETQSDITRKKPSDAILKSPRYSAKKGERQNDSRETNPS